MYVDQRVVQTRRHEETRTFTDVADNAPRDGICVDPDTFRRLFLGRKSSGISTNEAFVCGEHLKRRGCWVRVEKARVYDVSYV